MFDAIQHSTVVKKNKNYIKCISMRWREYLNKIAYWILSKMFEIANHVCSSFYCLSMELGITAGIQFKVF